MRVSSLNRNAALSVMTTMLLGAVMLTVVGSVVAEDDPLFATRKPAPEWMPAPVPVENSTAKTEAEMKPYTDTIPGTKFTFDMVPIPGGKFLIGSPEDEDDRCDDEGPQAEVTLKPFWMGKHEITWEEYAQFQQKLDIKLRKEAGTDATQYDTLAEAIARPTPAYADMTFGMGFEGGYPAICMTQFAAKMYCKWLSAKTGRYYRLPTEAEWEYACRAGTDTAYSFGDDVDDLEDYGWYYDNADDEYQKVGELKPNPWGLYDMHGNVAEWCLDQYVEDRYQKIKDGDLSPFVPPTTLYPRVVRGGSWYDDPEYLRSATRIQSTPDWKTQDPQIPQSIWYHTDAIYVGFRIVRPLEMPTAEEARQYEPDPKIMDEYNRLNDRS